MVTRRNFLAGMIAAASAPAIVKAENMMKIFVPPAKKFVMLDEYIFTIYPTTIIGPEEDYSTDFAEAVMRNNQQLKDAVSESSVFKQHEADLKELLSKPGFALKGVAAEHVQRTLANFAFLRA